MPSESPPKREVPAFLRKNEKKVEPQKPEMKKDKPTPKKLPQDKLPNKA